MIQNCFQCSPDGKYCVTCQKGTVDISGKGKGPCIIPTSDICPQKCDKGCNSGFVCDSSSNCCVSTGIPGTTKTPGKACLKTQGGPLNDNIRCANDKDICSKSIKKYPNCKGYTGYCKGNGFCHFSAP